MDFGYPKIAIVCSNLAEGMDFHPRFSALCCLMCKEAGPCGELLLSVTDCKKEVTQKGEGS
jgi:hypothetical protein